MRGGRGTSLGPLSGRLSGGYTASSIPRSRQSNFSPLQLSGATGPHSPASPSLSAGDAVSEGSVGTEEINAQQLTSIANTLRAVHEAIKKLDLRLSSVEQKQTKIVDSIKELTSLIKNNERTNFSIKGSTWEVRKW